MTAAPARKSLRWWLLGLGVGAAFLWLALGEANLADTWRTLRQADPAWALAAWAAGVLFMAVKALRWQLLLQPLHRFSLGVLQAAVYAGTAANLLVPHSGELLRATLLGLKAHRPASPILATVLLERILDFAALALLAALGVALQPEGSQWLVAGGLTGLALVALGVGAVALSLRPSVRARALTHRLIGLLPGHVGAWLALQLRRALAGLQPIRRPSRWLVLFGLSVLQWAGIVAAVAACAQAVGATLPLAGAILVFVIMVVGLTLPSPPVQLGATQLAFVFGFEWHGASGTQGLAASAVYTLVVLGWMLIGGAAMGAWPDWRRRHPAPSHAADTRA
jgi:uncharacterized membrane protein YbhN (UPF0104 family)